MTASKKELQINLLPERGFEQTTTGRVLAWILSTFRIIVIVTEIIVMIAFLSRFWLDAQNTDLTEEIQRKQALLVALQDFDNEFRDVQKRLDFFTQSTSNQGLYTKSLNTIRSYLPPEVFLTTLSLSSEGINIEGETPSEISVQQLMVNLNSTDLFDTVGLAELKTSQANSSLLKFNIISSFKSNKTN